MSSSYIGEIRMFAGTFAPVGWAFCDGQLLPISQHDALFNLIGITYGGDGQTTFALPDLRGRIPVGQGSLFGQHDFLVGETGGAEEVTLTTSQIPSHHHPWTVVGDRSGTSAVPAGARPAQSTSVTPYLQESPINALAADAATPTGGSQPHSNLQPYLCVHFIISLDGEYPSQI